MLTDNANSGRANAKPAFASTMAAVLLAVLLALVLGLPAEAAKNKHVGVAAAVNPDATGEPPSKPVYELFVGAQLVHNEHIRTQANGRTQVLFLDGSSLTIGPNADMVIDKFVYDPEAKVGQMAISATKGVFRFVGGHISKKSTVLINTPNAQIGIRGGVVIIEVGAVTRATFLFGKEMTVTAGGQTRRVTRSGFTIVAPAPGLPPLPPEPVTIEIISESLAPLETTPEEGPTGPLILTDQDVEDTQLALLGSDGEPELLTQTLSDGDPEATGTRLPPPPPPPETIEGTTGTTTTTSGGGGGSGTIGGLSGRYKSAPAGGAGNGTRDGDINYNRPLSGSIGSGRFFGSTAGGGSLSVPVGSPGTSLAFTASQGTSPFGRVSGKSHFAPNGEFVYFDLIQVDNGNTRATAFAGKPMPLSALPTSGTTSYLLSADYVLNSNIPFIRGSDGGNIVGPPRGDNGGIIWNSSGTRGNFAFLSHYVQGAGAIQKSAASLMGGRVLLDSNGRPYLSGQMRGSAQLSASTAPIIMHSPIASTPDANGNHFYGRNGPEHFALQAAIVNPSTGATTPSAATSITGVTATSYFPNTYALRPTNNEPLILDTRTTRPNLEGFAAGVEWHLNSGGGLIGLNLKMTELGNPSNVSVKTDKTNNTMSAVFNLADPGTSLNRRLLRFGETTPTGRSLFIDDEAFGAIESATASKINGVNAAATFAYMFSDELDGNFLPAGVSFCQNCEALAWGFWGGQLVAGSGDRYNYHLGTWVAGEIPNASEILGLTGSATYTGHVAGVVSKGTSSYLAVGKFQTTYNFGSGTGTVTVTSFDGGDYAGAINKLGTGLENRFAGTLTSTFGPSRTGNLDGAFYRTHGKANGSVGGQIKFFAAGYNAATTFAASQ